MKDRPLLLAGLVSLIVASLAHVGAAWGGAGVRPGVVDLSAINAQIAVLQQSVTTAQTTANAAQTAASGTVKTADLPAAVMANLPFASSTPPTEAMSPTAGSAGVANTIRRGDAVTPPVRRSMIVTTAANGTFSGTWTTASTSSAPVLQLTPVSATGSIDCQLTAPPTSTTFAGKCVQNQALPALAAMSGISLLTQLVTGVNSIVAALTGFQTAVPVGAGVQVHVTALPPTQTV